LKGFFKVIAPEKDIYPVFLRYEETSIIGFKLGKQGFFLQLIDTSESKRVTSNNKIDGCDILLLSIAYSRRISGEKLPFKVCVFGQLFLVCSGG
jgi:hypothetical protein